jgi:hypothetical protein
MSSSLKPFVVKFWDVRSVHRVRKVKARDRYEAEARVRKAAFGSFGHYAQIDPAFTHLYMEA